MSANPAHPSSPSPVTQVPANPWPQRLLALGVGFAVVAMLWLFVWGLGKRAQGTVGLAPSTLREAPPFTLQLFATPGGGGGGSFSLAEQRGKPVLVNFWASWCLPCEDEAPVLERAWRRYRDRVAFVGVDVQDTAQAAGAFLARHNVTYPNGMDASGEVSIAYGMSGVPESYFVSRDGRIARKWAGPLNDQQVTTFLEEFLR